MREGHKALRAFEDYWAMGDERSLERLCDQYREAAASGETFGTRNLGRLKTWSKEHGWQDRLKERVAEELEERRRKLERRMTKMRDRAMTGIEADTNRYIEQLVNNPGEPILVTNIASFTQALEMFYKLGGEPLAERREVTGAGGTPLAVNAEVTHEHTMPDNGELTVFLRNAADLAGSLADREADSSGNGDGDEASPEGVGAPEPEDG